MKTRKVPVAFTLLEVMIALLLVAVLLAITMGVMGTMKKKAQSVECVSNLRFIGSATIRFTVDHGGYLPGVRLSETQAGVASSVSPTVNINSWNRLTRALAPYLGTTMPEDGSLFVVEAFACPGIRAIAPELIDDPTAAVYRLNPFTLPGLGQNAFGNPSRTTQKESVRLNRILQPATTYMMGDVDREARGVGSWPMTDRPAHGETRNYLFFDGHVETWPASREP
ncbi:MAG TPA: hypothetical protein VNQ90_19815 [Chthoniobacteraceae bacterium]|nr:hypothetical protein [Chthoniobacteraceae bacterium]